MISANCRVRLTADDFKFVVQALSRNEKDSVSLVRLLTDEETRDSILDHDELCRKILDSPERLRISPHLLFYVLCRRVLRGTPVKSRETADFVASLLNGFLRTARQEENDETGERSMRYLSDMMRALSRANTREAFLIRSQMANYALFVSGIFAGNVQLRTRRKGAPDLSFYEAVGQMNYRAAAEYREAKKFHLQGIYEDLAGGFREVRLALNDLAGRLLHFDSSSHPTVA